MNLILRFSLYLFCINICFCLELQIGSPMPIVDHNLIEISGENITLNDVKGENTICLNFTLIKIK